jgi:hypothetical protein
LQPYYDKKKKKFCKIAWAISDPRSNTLENGLVILVVNV